MDSQLPLLRANHCVAGGNTLRSCLGAPRHRETKMAAGWIEQPT
jgi:hypothetical protein